MTRDEQIIEASHNYSKTLNKKMAFDYKDMKCAFEEGAEWADANPKSPWISVEEDLHNNPKYLKQPDYSSWVIALTENGEVIPAQMIVMSGKWIWHSKLSRKHEDINHWMFIPKFPMEYYV